MQGGYAVEPSDRIAVDEGQGEEDEAFVYYGGKDTGVYWITDEEGHEAFLDVRSGYFSGFRFLGCDPWFDDPETDYIRVTEDGNTYAYINRRNGEFLTDYIFQQMNLVGFVGTFAVEQLEASGAWVVLDIYGTLTLLPEGCEPVDWYENLDDDLRNGRILVQREDGSTFIYEIEVPLDPNQPMNYDFDTYVYEMSEDDLIADVEQEYPDWTIVDSGQYWSGRWKNELACWMEVSLACVENHTLYQKTLSVQVNPLKRGEPVPWEVTDWAPIPLTQEAEDILLQEIGLADLYTDEDGYERDPFKLSYLIVPGCASFLLDDGETWCELFSYPTALAGIVINADGQKAVRIANWDGEQYDEVVSSRFFQDGLYAIESYQSSGRTIALDCKTCSPQFRRQPDGRWLFTGIADGNWSLYGIYSDYVTDATELALYDSNDVLHYGVPTFERDLTKADLTAYPDFIRDVIPLLDSSAFACVRADGAAMLDGPNGQLIAICYARLTGKTLQREDGFVQLQIGSEEQGMTGWFAEGDLAFGPEIENVRCGFPSHSEDDTDGYYLIRELRGVNPKDLMDYRFFVWLIGKLPNGDWLVQLDVDIVCTAHEDAFREIGPAREIWANFEADYDRYEHEMREWAEEEALEQEQLERLDQLYDTVFDRVPYPGNPAFMDYPETLRSLYVVLIFDMEIQNGGVNQFFFNEGTTCARLLPDALRTTGLDDIADLYESFLTDNDITLEQIESIRDPDSDFLDMLDLMDCNAFDDAYTQIRYYTDFDQRVLDYADLHPEVWGGDGMGE